MAVPKPKCTATNKKTGLRCGQYPAIGATVCRFHGGGAPQVKRKAQERVLELRDLAADLLETQLRAKKAGAATTLSAVERLTDLASRMEDRESGKQGHSDLDVFLEALRRDPVSDR